MTYLAINNTTRASGAAAAAPVGQPSSTAGGRSAPVARTLPYRGGLSSQCEAERQIDLQVSICEYNFRENNQTY